MVTHARKLVNLQHNPAVNRSGIDFFFHVEVVKHFIYVSSAKDSVAAVLLLYDILQCRRIVLVIDFAYQFFYNVLHGHQTRCTAILIDYDSYVGLHSLQPLEQLRDFHGTGHEYYRLHIFRHRCICASYIIVEILLVQHSHYVIKIVLIYRQSGETGAQEKFCNFVLCLIDFNCLYIHSRSKHVPCLQVVELDSILNQLALIRVDTSLCLCLLHNSKKLVLCNRVDTVSVKQLGQKLFPPSENPVYRSQKHHKESEKRGAEHCKLFRVFLGKALWGNFSENQYNHCNYCCSNGCTVHRIKLHKQNGCNS